MHSLRAHHVYLESARPVQLGGVGGVGGLGDGAALTATITITLNTLIALSMTPVVGVLSIPLQRVQRRASHHTSHAISQRAGDAQKSEESIHGEPGLGAQGLALGVVSRLTVSLRTSLVEVIFCASCNKFDASELRPLATITSAKCAAMSLSGRKL